MATTRRRFIIGNLILACAAVALLVTSLATSFWIEATLSDPDDVFKDSKLNYGLFVGHVAGIRAIQVEMDLSSKPLSLLIHMNFRMCTRTCHFAGPLFHVSLPIRLLTVLTANMRGGVAEGSDER